MLKSRPALAVTCLGHRDPVVEVARKKHKSATLARSSSEAPPDDPEVRSKARHCLAKGTGVNTFCIKNLD